MPQDRRPKVLVADDEPFIIRLLERYLGSRGYDVVGVSDGSDVLARVRATNPQLVLLDIRMPGRSGLAVLPDLRREFPQIPVIMLTAANDDLMRTESLEYGATDYLMKPFDLTQVEQVISQRIQREL